MPLLDENRLLPPEPSTRGIARRLYETVRTAPIISPHGHVNPAWFTANKPFADATELLIIPDHYLLRMLVSQGISLDQLGIPRCDGTRVQSDNLEIWRLFANHYHLFRGTPSRLWLDHVFQELFGLNERLTLANADSYYAHINECLTQEEFLPRNLFDQFNIEVLATTESATDTLSHHQALRASNWSARIITTYRPDAVIDPEHPDFITNVNVLGELTGEAVTTWDGYLNAHRARRKFFRAQGAKATDHGHPTARTCKLDTTEVKNLYDKALRGIITADEAELFRGHMLLEMARMSVDDKMVMQLHPGSCRNHAPGILAAFGPDKGFDIPRPINYVEGLKPLLDDVGQNPNLTLILFTLDETAYGRELAPLAGAYPTLRLGPAWWFFDSADGMRRYRELVTETAGFYNTVGFNDDTRAFCSIPARHDVARRVDAGFLAELVMAGRLAEDEAFELITDLTTNLARAAYKL